MFVILLAVVPEILTEEDEEITANTCCNVDDKKLREYDEKLELIMKSCIIDLGLASKFSYFFLSKKDEKLSFFRQTKRMRNNKLHSFALSTVLEES